jgi:Zn-dependent protease with chaperone function
MDFFAHQERARQRSSILVVFYGLAVLAIALGVYALLMTALHVGASDDPGQTPFWWNGSAFFWTMLLVPGVIMAGSAYKIQALRQGGGAGVARMLGGTPVRADTRDPEERRLLNVVEEMALATGIPVPMVYLLTEERGINAFAAGYSQRDAVIGVTRGCMQELSRDELQGVIAHEFSHIVNGDMRLNIRLMGVLFGIIMVTMIGRVLMRTGYMSGGSSRGGNKKGGNPLPLIGLALMIIGYVGVFFANLIKSAISRQREFLADAAAVQFTRNPNGIACALSRIARLSLGSKIRNTHAEEAGHLFFGDCSRRFVSLFATHPPLPERIRRIDTSGQLRETARKQTATTTPPPRDTESITAETELAGIVNLMAAQAIMGQTPARIEDATHDILQARVTLYAMLWFDQQTFQQRQREILTRLDPEALPYLNDALPSVRSLDAAARLPVAERLLPALRLMPPAFFPRFSQALIELTEANEEINLFEFAIRSMILRNLGAAFGTVERTEIRYRRIENVQTQIETLLAALARWGTPPQPQPHPVIGRACKACTWMPATRVMFHSRMWNLPSRACPTLHPLSNAGPSRPAPLPFCTMGISTRISMNCCGQSPMVSTFPCPHCNQPPGKLPREPAYDLHNQL